MKCPKCLYLGFETGDRCKNCGYDFSLLSDERDEAGDISAVDHAGEMAFADTSADGELMLRSADLPLRGSDVPPRSADLPLRGAELASPSADVALRGAVEATGQLPEADVPIEGGWDGPPAHQYWESIDAQASGHAVGSGGTHRDADDVRAPALPLFAPDAVDDEPLVRLPPAPRPPLAVRKTPETPRMRAVRAIESPGRTRVPFDDPVLEFVEEPGEPDAEPLDDFVPAAPSYDAAPRTAVEDSSASPLGARLAAAAIDWAILLGIDAAVLYFTLRLTALSFAEWRVLPLLPLAFFLVSLKAAYFTAFTAAGGQTIGKMATHIRVVSDDLRRLDASQAVRRAFLGLASVATLGAPFLPALMDPARRGVHDRLSGTRVVGLSSR